MPDSTAGEMRNTYVELIKRTVTGYEWLGGDTDFADFNALTWLYPLLERGGALVIDDWHLVGCRFAVNAYRERHGIKGEVLAKDGNGYWIKQQNFGEPEPS